MNTQKQRVPKSVRINHQEEIMSAEIMEYYHLESYSQMVRFLIYQTFKAIKDADKTVK